jgi:hypothetical protein
MKAFMFGDEEYYFRRKIFKVQNMGDTFGRFTTLNKYDYEKLYAWINMLDDLNSKSNFLPYLSAYYFSQTQNVKDVIYVVNYLVRHAEKNVNKKWWWLYQASFLSNYRLKDRGLTLQIVDKLNSLPGGILPLWIRQNLIGYLSTNGQDCESLRMLLAMEREYGDIQSEKDPKIREKKEAELSYMHFFMKNVIQKLKANKIDVGECIKNFRGGI